MTPTTTGGEEQAGHIWVGCGSGGLAILAASGQQAGAIALRSHPEAFQLEARGSREGAVDIFRKRDPNHYEPVGRTRTAPGARTGLFVPRLDRLFVAVPHRGSQASKVLVYVPTGSAP